MRTETKACRYGKMEYLPNDIYQGRALGIYGEWAEGEMAIFREVLRPGDVAADVGANIGSLTLGMAQVVGPNGAVHAFEPQPELYEILCRNIALNGLAHVVAHREAAGAAPGAIRVPAADYDKPGNFGGVALGGEQGAEVRVVTIDSLGLPRLRLLKADVEGMEADVLAGARETIQRLSPALYVENDRPDKSEALIALILDLGYRCGGTSRRCSIPRISSGKSRTSFPVSYPATCWLCRAQQKPRWCCRRS